MTKPIQIYVDADACPVKNEIYRVAERHGLEVHVVSNSPIAVPREPWIKRVVVGAATDAADDWIAGRAGASDIVITADGPAVTHAGDFSLVTASKPATAGEILSLFATGLGPTRTILDAGQTFPSSPLAAVNSPIEVTVNGESAEVLSAVGYPGTTDAYQVNFRVPLRAGTGSMTLQISSAWIPGAPITIPMK